MSNYPLETIRHSAAHVMAAAVQQLYPDAKFDIGPSTENGFYYDFDMEHRLVTEDLMNWLAAAFRNFCCISTRPRSPLA